MQASLAPTFLRIVQFFRGGEEPATPDQTGFAAVLDEAGAAEAPADPTAPPSEVAAPDVAALVAVPRPDATRDVSLIGVVFDETGWAADEPVDAPDVDATTDFAEPSSANATPDAAPPPGHPPGAPVPSLPRMAQQPSGRGSGLSGPSPEIDPQANSGADAIDPGASAETEAEAEDRIHPHAGPSDAPSARIAESPATNTLGVAPTPLAAGQGKASGDLGDKAELSRAAATTTAKSALEPASARSTPSGPQADPAPAIERSAETPTRLAEMTSAEFGRSSVPATEAGRPVRTAPAEQPSDRATGIATASSREAVRDGGETSSSLPSPSLDQADAGSVPRSSDAAADEPPIDSGQAAEALQTGAPHVRRDGATRIGQSLSAAPEAAPSAAPAIQPSMAPPPRPAPPRGPKAETEAVVPAERAGTTATTGPSPVQSDPPPAQSTPLPATAVFEPPGSRRPTELPWSSQSLAGASLVTKTEPGRIAPRPQPSRTQTAARSAESAEPARDISSPVSTLTTEKAAEGLAVNLLPQARSIGRVAAAADPAVGSGGSETRVDPMSGLAVPTDRATGHGQAQRAPSHAQAATAQQDLPASWPGAQIAARIRMTQDHSIDIELSPRELGHLKLSLHPAAEGLTIAIAAERPETLDLLKRHADQLMRDIRDTGLGNATFYFAQDRSTGSQRRSDRSRPEAEEDFPRLAETRGPQAAAPTSASRAIPTSETLDLRL
ncbi:flagellar hook-length control protein FliK [Frigidibacter sp. MR17.24]|uniref:flagellar hook-length control protein FliK n=1 Tax=Frigidibacter sp. MR17.24 TaxID=3127345 RepID=UPI003012D70D